MNGSILRLISGRETMENPLDFCVGEQFLKGNTEYELAKAHKAFYEWWDKCLKSRPDEEQAAYDAIYTYMSALEQFHHENGVRWGIRFMCEAMSGGRTLGEVRKMEI